MNEVSRGRQRAERRQWLTFRTYWYGNLVSVIGDYLTLLALPLAAFELSHSAVVTAAVEVMEVGATVLFGPSLGAIADRSSPIRMLLLSDLLRGGLLALLAIAMATGSATWWMVLTVSFGLALLRSLHDGSESGLLARIVPHDMEVRAYSRLEASDGIGHLTGPTVGGLLASVTLGLCFGVDAFTFVFASLMVLAVGRRARIERREPDGDQPSIGADIAVAIRAILAQKRYLQWVVVLALSNLAMAPFGALLIPFARKELGAGPALTGVLVAVGGVGGLLAVPFLDRQREVRLNHGAWALLLQALLCVVVGLIESPVTVVVAMIGVGGAVAVSRSNSNAYRLLLFPPDMQGKIQLASRTVLWSVTLIGVLVGGVLAEAIGARWVFVLYGTIGAVGIVVAGNVRVLVEEPPPRP